MIKESKQENAKHLVSSMLKEPDISKYVNRIKKHDANTYTHSVNVAELVARLGFKLGYDEKKVFTYAKAGLLHDLGVVTLDKDLIKKNPLSVEEFHTVRNRIDYSIDILKEDSFDEDIIEILTIHSSIIKEGKLTVSKSNRQIIGGRILNIANKYEALTSDRPYRKKKSHEEAIQTLKYENAEELMFIECLDSLEYEKKGLKGFCI